MVASDGNIDHPLIVIRKVVSLRRVSRGSEVVDVSVMADLLESVAVLLLDSPTVVQGVGEFK